MKSLLKRFLLFVGILLMLALVADLLLSYKLKNMYLYAGENEVWNDIYEHKVTDDCLIYGSSRAKVHIDPQIIEEVTRVPTYNFGMDAQTFRIQELRHRVNVKENGYPKYIIYSLDAFTLGETRGLFNKLPFAPYLFWNTEMMKDLETYEDGYTYTECFIPLIRYSGFYSALVDAIKNISDPVHHKERVKGYKIENQKWNGDFKRVQEDMGTYPIKITPELKEKYIAFLEECIEHDVKIAFVYTPEHVYGQQFMTNRDSVVSLYKELSSKYEIPYFDYTSDSICSDTAYFYNTMHLNRKGSIIISNRIAEDLEHIGFFEEKKN